MKRRDLVQHLEAHGCEFLREGDRHTLARKVCRDLGIPDPPHS